MSDPVINSNPENKRIDFNMIYPFTDKPKIVPFLKKAVALIFLLGCLFWYGTHLVSVYLVSNSLEMDKWWLVEVKALTTGVIEGVEVELLEKSLMATLKKRIFMKSLERSLLYALPFLMLYFFYQAFKKERYDKNIYSVGGLYLIVTMLYFVFIGIMLFWKNNLFYDDFPPSIKEWLNKNGIGPYPEQFNDPGLAVSVPDPKKYTDFYWIGKVVLNQTLIWQFIRASNIIMIVVLFINIILLVLLFILKPKIDPEKVSKIQKEIRKKAEANLAGKEYQMDSSIF